ncbi:MAG: hypothetical protein QOF43_2537 [Gaiellaceae bacterium]|nr:hypothetical protein [Gaiellaceae bacterium]
MGSRLLPLSLALGALVADAAGLHQVASYLVLFAIPAAAAAAFVAVADVLEGKNARVRAVTTGLALALLVVGSAVRASAVTGAHVPVVAISAAIAASLLYLAPIVGWLFEPVAPKVRPLRVPVAD